MSDIVWEWFFETRTGIRIVVEITKQGPNSYRVSEGILPPGVNGVEPKNFESEEDAYRYVQENYIPGRRTQGWTIVDPGVQSTTFERGDYAGFHVEGQRFAEDRWDIKVWRKGSARDSHGRYAVMKGQFHKVTVDTPTSVNARREILQDLGVDPSVDSDMKEAVLHLIEEWEAERTLTKNP